MRKTLVPLPNTAERIRALLSVTVSTTETLEQHLCVLLLKYYSLQLTPADFSSVDLDTYYQMNIQVIGERDVVLDQGRDLARLKAALASETRDVIQQSAPERFTRSRITEWNFGELSPVLPQQRGDMKVLAYPALQDTQDSVSLVLLDNEQEAAEQTQRAVVRLAMLALPQQVKYVHKESFRNSKVRLILGRVGAETVLKDDLVYAVFMHCFTVNKNPPRDKDAFELFLTSHKSALAETAKQLDSALSEAALCWQAIQLRLDTLIAADALEAVQDMRSQLQHLFYPGFIRQTSLFHLLQYPRYLDALLKRIDKMRGQVGRDRQMTQQVQRYWKPLCTMLEKQPISSWTPAQQSARWLLEEWRIAQFAQPMKTLMPASEKRIEEAWCLAKFVVR
jgi:ATP-dependent helicase HrpA